MIQKFSSSMMKIILNFNFRYIFNWLNLMRSRLNIITIGLNLCWKKLNEIIKALCISIIFITGLVYYFVVFASLISSILFAIIGMVLIVFRLYTITKSNNQYGSSILAYPLFKDFWLYLNTKIIAIMAIYVINVGYAGFNDPKFIFICLAVICAFLFFISSDYVCSRAFIIQQQFLIITRAFENWDVGLDNNNRATNDQKDISTDNQADILSKSEANPSSIKEGAQLDNFNSNNNIGRCPQNKSNNKLLLNRFNCKTKWFKGPLRSPGLYNGFVLSRGYSNSTKDLKAKDFDVFFNKDQLKNTNNSIADKNKTQGNEVLANNNENKKLAESMSILKDLKNDSLINILNKYGKDITIKKIEDLDDTFIRLVALLESVKHDINITDINLIKKEMFNSIANLGIKTDIISKIFKDYTMSLESFIKSDPHTQVVENLINDIKNNNCW